MRDNACSWHHQVSYPERSTISRRAVSSTMAPMAENVLDVATVYHSTSVLSSEGATCGCFSPRSEPTAVLRDVSARVFGGEVLAVLGSKGSGKRALLDVIGELCGWKYFIIFFLFFFLSKSLEMNWDDEKVEVGVL